MPILGGGIASTTPRSASSSDKPMDQPMDSNLDIHPQSSRQHVSGELPTSDILPPLSDDINFDSTILHKQSGVIGINDATNNGILALSSTPLEQSTTIAELKRRSKPTKTTEKWRKKALPQFQRRFPSQRHPTLTLRKRKPKKRAILTSDKLGTLVNNVSQISGIIHNIPTANIPEVHEDIPKLHKQHITMDTNNVHYL